MKSFIVFIALFLTIIIYSLVGTNNNVEKIKKLTLLEMPKRNWKILRYEGWEYGSWNHHGGKVWYHVCNIDNPSIQYRVFVTMWDNELQWYYQEPEILNRIDIQEFD